MSTIRDQEVFYDERWSKAARVNRLALSRLRAILAALEATGLEAPRILDLGAGCGWLSAILDEFGPTTGVELSGAAVARAQRRHPEVCFRAGNLFEMPIEQAYYDVVVSQEVLEHVDDQPGYLEIARRCLRPGGFLILTTPNADNLRWWSEEQRAAWGRQPIEKWLTVAQLRRLVSAGHDVIRLETVVPTFGRRGPFRLLNSTRLRSLLQALGLLGLRDRLLLRARFGLHTVVLARRR